MEKQGFFQRGARSRILHYLYLLPMLLGFRPLLVRFDWVSFVLYSLGFVLLIGLIIYSNRIPYILYDDEGLQIQLEYREAREVHRFDEVLGYHVKRPGVVRLFSLEHKPLTIRIGRKDSQRFLELLIEKGISPVNKEVNRGKK